jgi:hypothetical protein
MADSVVDAVGFLSDHIFSKQERVNGQTFR